MRSKKNSKKVKKALIELKLGARYFFDDMELCIRFINQDIGLLYPTFSDPDDYFVAAHIAYAKINRYGKIERL